MKKENDTSPQCPDCVVSSICNKRRKPYNTGCKQKGNRNYNGFCTHCFANILQIILKQKALERRAKK